ncbi:MAG: sigma-54 dependent transcriptional regulator [Proteobacteria bacterium]|nr:sigma-54 dependent transcriptional regulator [Pseudomonadota bacterium]MBU1546458.1 sigma-54 dependent transcriptional regulator [Pseudomonadota bacterium]MBU2619562.1 sigma-54 dependent transcriptional regulator [Pseudomonadota bacterium]
MAGDGGRLLIIDDEESMLEMLSIVTSKGGYQVTLARNGEEGLGALGKGSFSLVLCDLKMPRLDGMGFLEKAKEQGIEAPIIMMSAYAAIEDAVAAIKAGAYDFITKPFKADEVLLTLGRAAEHMRLRRENLLLRRQIDDLQREQGLDDMVGKSGVMASFLQTVVKVAQYDTTVLITGESGTGKELVARGIHHKSGRAGKPFLAVNCGGMPSSLLESELFGYVKGAFTGAEKDRKGIFQEAHGGTLFLDEIGELPPDAQVKLLRVLQEREVRPVGGARTVRVDVRVLAATARDLEEEVAAGRFREDLFYRLNVIRLHVPPLRERMEDIPLLCTRLLDRIAAKLDRLPPELPPATLAVLLRHRWPGNVRELENVLERALVLSDGSLIMTEHLPENFVGLTEPCRAGIEKTLGTYSLKKGQKEMERALIAQALAATGGNKTKAGLLLEISYPSLLSKMKEYGL